MRIFTIYMAVLLASMSGCKKYYTVWENKNFPESEWEMKYKLDKAECSTEAYKALNMAEMNHAPILLAFNEHSNDETSAILIAQTRDQIFIDSFNKSYERSQAIRDQQKLQRSSPEMQEQRRRDEVYNNVFSACMYKKDWVEVKRER